MPLTCSATVPVFEIVSVDVAVLPTDTLPKARFPWRPMTRVGGGPLPGDGIGVGDGLGAGAGVGAGAGTGTGVDVGGATGDGEVVAGGEGAAEGGGLGPFWFPPRNGPIRTPPGTIDSRPGSRLR